MTMVTVLVLMLLSAAAGAPGASGRHPQGNAQANATLDHARRDAMADEQQTREDKTTLDKKRAVRKRESHTRAKRGQKEESRAGGRAQPRERAPENHEGAPAQPDTDDDSAVTVRLERHSMAVGR